MPPVERLGQRAADGPARVVDEDVHAADLLLDASGERVDGVEVGQIAFDGKRVAAVGEDALGEIVQQVLAAGDHDDGCSLRANFSAAASPMPDDAPVSRMRLPSRSTSCWPGRYSSNCGAIGGRMLASTSSLASRRSGLLLAQSL